MQLTSTCRDLGFGVTEEHHAFARSHAQPGPLQIPHDLAASASAFTRVHQSVRQSALCRSHIVSKPVEAIATQQPASSLCHGYTTAKSDKLRVTVFVTVRVPLASPTRENPNGKTGATPLARALLRHHHFRWTWSRRHHIPPRANDHFRSRLGG